MSDIATWIVLALTGALAIERVFVNASAYWPRIVEQETPIVESIVKDVETGNLQEAISDGQRAVTTAQVVLTQT